MRSLPGDLFNCMSFIILSRVFLSISYLVGIMFLQYVLSNIPNHFALLLNLVSLCQIFCQNDWTSSLVGIFSNLILPPLKSRYTPFGLLKNLRLINFLSWFLFCVFSFLQVAFNSCFNRVNLKSRVFCLVLPYFFLKFSLKVFLCLVNLSVFLQFITVVNCPIVFLRLFLLLSMFVIHFGGYVFGR